MKSLRWLLPLLVLSLLLATSATPLPVAATNPCSTVSGPPPSLPGEPVPTIGGTITLDSTTVVSGATIDLYRCDGTTAVSAGSDTTDSNGDYLFDSLTEDKWYYVEASLTGPLAGKSPATGTDNPSSLIGVGEGDPNVDMDFE